MDELLRETQFDAGPNGMYAAPRMRGAHTGRDEVRYSIAHTSRLRVPPPRLAALVESLEPELQPFIEPESGRIGTGLIALMGGAVHFAEPEVTDFARTLIKAAALLGSEASVRILRGWIAGEPYHFRIKLLLTGVQCDQPLALEAEGIQVEQLPKGGYPADLAPYFPPLFLDMPSLNAYDLFGRTVLSVDGTASPALYRPTRTHGDDPDWNLRQVWAGGKIPCLTTEGWREGLLEVLSIACDGHVDWTHDWRDVGDVAAFNLGTSTPSWRVGVHPGGDVRLEKQHLELARDLDVQWHARRQQGRSPEIAIRYWLKSKRPGVGLSDRFVDLRTALEALFTPGDRAELSFRLALLGAWDLGADFEERRRYYDLLRAAYTCGSKAVHSGGVKGTQENHKTLADAQSACRKAILQRLAEAEEPRDPIDVALGAPSGRSSGLTAV